MKANFKNILILLVIVGIVIVGTSYFSTKNKDGKSFVYSDLIELFEEDLVRDFVIDEKATIELNAFVVTKNEDGSYKFELNDKGERKVETFKYTFS